MTVQLLKFTLTLTFTLILLLAQSQLYASEGDSNNPRAEVTTSSTTPAGDTVMAHGEVVNLSYISVIDGFTLSECSISFVDTLLLAANKTTSVVENTSFSGWQVHARYNRDQYSGHMPDIKNKMIWYQVICAKNSGPVKTYPRKHRF